MIKSVFFRIFVYIVTFLVCRFLYVVMAFLLGFGSASDHLYEDIGLNIMLVLINITTIYFILKRYRVKEFVIVLCLTIFAWIIMYFYYK